MVSARVQSHFKRTLIADTFLLLATHVAQTCRWLLCYEITFINPSEVFFVSLQNFYSQNIFISLLINYTMAVYEDVDVRTIALNVAEASWNVMAQAQKPDFVFRRNGRVHLNRWGASVQSTTGSRGVRIGGSNAGYTVFRGSVKGTAYPLHSPVFPSIPHPCVTVYHQISVGVYLDCWCVWRD